MNQNIRAAEYAVRGKMVLRAQEFERELAAGKKLAFDRVVYCNIGNPQQLGQKPLSFIRQVIALVECPDLLEKEQLGMLFPKDAIERARSILKEAGSTGAYSESQGRLHVRKNIAKFINLRDGFPENHPYASPENIFLTDGASPGVQTILKLLVRGTNDGIMTPIPQYPLYSATIASLGGSLVPYYLVEEKNWGLEIEELNSSVKKAKASGVFPRALVVINPGNPTGSCLTEENMEQIIKFCHENSILLMADEVYQENVYVKNKKFTSFKRKLYDMPQYKDLELVSFHSTSKGVTGECGKRGGYFELTNIDPAVKEQIYKTLSISLCPNITGQLTVDLMVNPPQPSDPSYKQYVDEKAAIFNSLKFRAELIEKKLNELPGISCQPAEGALYAFPKIELPSGAIEKANKEGVLPDAYYCMKLLEATGLCVVPGSGFGQREGEYHFRTTFLPSEEHLRTVLEGFKTFHLKFLEEHKKL